MPGDDMVNKVPMEAKPRCPYCKREFLSLQINEARTTGLIRCPICRLVFSLEEVLEG